ncbi:MAG: hypothetical protein COV34_02700 [Candidatus Zambryskibacteria bacterium CG10_big_fil_rev_8_21_14_0_10_42_12]|uniref:Sodium/calcium exchanger membrane region domain-containing protein n=1 Tax=Candidatus Zambryskibacteria bacterium CG10_big_fil_rev_8_21_14_0_10_42_12 TaxID=1975115 RepID=A0A2H0QUL9_9BACT|nr:MAG: hypothetical protein COV34_02700 [Candidatus Zambryskibacteria bacterium CG10_big_fil_rev_8_21_14_0_10_42_12]
MWTLILFIVGFYILVKGAQILVEGASDIARFLRVPAWFIGVVIVGIGTSMPEFAINIAAVLEHDPVGVSTIIGSNIFNALFILGLVSIIAPPAIEKKLVSKNLLINLAVILLVGIMFLFGFKESFIGIDRLESFILFLLFLVWVLWEIFGSHGVTRVKDRDKNLAVGYTLLTIVLGMLGVIFGGRWVVSGALRGADLLGIGSSVIGLLIIGVGTSITELTVSVTAALKKRSDIAIGNIVGSNVFDFLGIFGIAGLFGNIPFAPDLYLDLLIAFAGVFIVFILIQKRGKFAITRGQGVALVMLYAVYFLFTIIRVPVIG